MSTEKHARLVSGSLPLTQAMMSKKITLSRHHLHADLHPARCATEVVLTRPPSKEAKATASATVCVGKPFSCLAPTPVARRTRSPCMM